MLYAWLFYGVFYTMTSLFTAWAFKAALGTDLCAILLGSFAAVQVLRFVPGAVRQGVLMINYHVCLTAYRLNYLYTLGLAISACLAPLAGLCILAGKYGLSRTFVAAQLAALVIWVNYIRGRKDVNCAKEYPPFVGQKRVAVVGGGCAGIVACKEMLAEGHDVVGFESASVLGGVWNSSDHTSKRTTGKTLSSSSRSNSFFGDFPLPSSANKDKTQHPTHYTEDDFRIYLLAYAKAFGVDELYRLGTSVVAASRSTVSDSSNGSWNITSLGPNGQETKETFDFLVVATGLNQTCSGLQLGPEGGKTSHTCALRGNQGYDGKKVVVVGLGESSSDASSEIANVAAEVHVIVRSPVLLLPRNTFGTKIAPDHKLSRLVLLCPQVQRLNA